MFFIVETSSIEDAMKILLSIFEIILLIRRLRFSVVIFCEWKIWRCYSFSSVSLLAYSVAVEHRKKMFVLIDVLKSLFPSSWLLNSISSKCSKWSAMSEFPRWCFFFSMSKEEIRSLEFFENCWCLQAQWLKTKSLLDRWNLPSGYVSSMESNYCAPENFLTVDPLQILLSVRRKKNVWWKRLSVDKRKSSSFRVLRFFSETIFLRTILTRSWWWDVGFKFNCWSRNESRISFFYL